MRNLRKRANGFGLAPPTERISWVACRLPCLAFKVRQLITVRSLPPRAPRVHGAYVASRRVNQLEEGRLCMACEPSCQRRVGDL